jgi:hypothetical protein
VAKGSGHCSLLQSRVSIEVAISLALQAFNQKELKEWFTASQIYRALEKLVVKIHY